MDAARTTASNVDVDVESHKDTNPIGLRTKEGRNKKKKKSNNFNLNII